MQAKNQILLIPLVFLTILALLLAPMHQAKASRVPPVGYWKFDEGSGSTAYDSSGNSNHGVIHAATWTEGRIGKALHFNGIDSWVQISHCSILSGLSQMTVEAWIKIESFQAPVKGIVSKASGTAMPTPDAEYALVLFNTTPAFEVYNGNYLVRAFAHQKTPNANTWYHVAGTWNGTYYAIYVNGVLCDSGINLPSSPYSYPIDLRIGRHGTYSWTYFNGTIDEVMIYNYARTAEEIWSDYVGIEQSQTPFWMQWWFWTIIALGIVAIALTFTTAHYRKKTFAKKEAKASATQSPKDYKVCPNCGANLPIDSKFCGKCGASLE